MKRLDSAKDEDKNILIDKRSGTAKTYLVRRSFLRRAVEADLNEGPPSEAEDEDVRDSHEREHREGDAEKGRRYNDACTRDLGRWLERSERTARRQCGQTRMDTTQKQERLRSVDRLLALILHHRGR